MKRQSNPVNLSKLASAGFLVSLLAASGSVAAPAAKSRLHGTVILPVTELSEIIKEIEVPSQGRMQKTGQIRLSLDLGAKRPQQMILDFDKMQVKIMTNQLLSASLLEAHGMKAMPVSVDESGEFQLLGLTYDRRNRSASATLSMSVRADVAFDSEPFKGGLAKNYKVDKCSYPANKCRRIALNLDGGGNVLSVTVESGGAETVTALDRGEFIFDKIAVPFEGERVLRVGNSIPRRDLAK